ncbi:MAG: hypothetical protein JW894_10975 [Bacteroidales bacterium]|nr:hypothetical protein [Bacteroidales bacterium]
MKNILNISLLLGLFLGLFLSCEDDTIEVEYSSAYPIAGEWIVSEYWDGEYGYGPYLLFIYNTSFSEDSIWIDNIYDSGIKAKAGITGETTFAVTGSPDVSGALGGGTVDIEGEVTLGDPDQIRFRVILYDASGVVIDDYYEIGQRKSGFD